MTAGRREWPAIIDHARAIVESYATPVTLRQLFYRLVADQTLRNTRSDYNTLSKLTAEARRDGAFPDLTDRGRTIHRDLDFDGVDDARRWLVSVYRRDRTEGQRWSIYLGVEKAGIVEQLRAWFGDLGVPILALGGYASQSYVDQVRADVEVSDRPAVLLYGGDFDPSGEDIDRDFLARTGCFDAQVRVALSAEQVLAYDLPVAYGKASDTRASAFVARHGHLVQVELDAIDPSELRRLYSAALDEYFDHDAYAAALAVEATDRARLAVAS